IDGLPNIDDVRARLDVLDFLAPFEAIAGDAIFQGRVSELDQLRNYIGVLPPQTLRSKIARVWPRPTARPALSVFGPGGVGKSALIGRFVLEHWRLTADERIPFAYLDMDRAALSVSDPAGLLLEMLRQLELQFPMLEQIRNMRSFVV